MITQKRIDNLKEKCRMFEKANRERKRFCQQAERFTQDLLKQGRTTIEELKRYFPRVEGEK